MATELKASRMSLRSWTHDDSLDDSDLRRLYDTERVKVTRPVKCVSYWSFYLVLIAFASLFLFGILVGFYVQERGTLTDGCSFHRRPDGLSTEKLDAVHHNIMYFMSGQSVGDYYRRLAPLVYPLYHPDWDTILADNIEGEFRKLNPDNVHVKEHSVVVTYPDPEKPNHLRIVGSPGHSFNITAKEAKGDNSEMNEEWPPFVAFSPSGNAQGKLVYCNYGRYVDFLRLGAGNVSVEGAVVLVQLGQNSVSDKVMQVKWAEKFGAVGVLLFCQSMDCRRKHSGMPYISAADFTDAADSIYPRIPIQTVQEVTARMLLQNLSITSLPQVWRTSLLKFLNQQNRTEYSEGFQVQLMVNNQRERKLVRNIITTIPGSMESDRYVMVGASRDSPANTALLLELLRALVYVRDTEAWLPRRGIKLVSWGGAQLSNFGMVQHIKNHHHLLNTELVTYIDLDLGTTGSDRMKTMSSPSLVTLIHNAAEMVPDPTNPEFSLADSWPVMSDGNVSLDDYPASSYHGNQQQHLMVNHVGVSMVTMFSPQMGASQIPQNSLELDLQHHFKYRLSSARVAALILLNLADRPLLPYDVERYINFITAVLQEALKTTQRIIDVNKNLIVGLHGLLNKLQDVGTKFSSKYLSKTSCLSQLDARKINNILSQLDSTFVEILTNHRSPCYLLNQDKKTGLLSVFKAVEDEYMITKNIEPVKNLIRTITSSLQQTLETLSINRDSL